MPYALLLLIGLMACSPAGARDWALIGYLDGRGDLRADALEHAAGMLQVSGAGAVHVAVSGPDGGNWSRERGGPLSQHSRAPRTAEESREGLAEFLAWARPRTDGYNRLLCLLGHGVPVSTGSASLLPSPRLLHADGDPGMTPDQLAECIRRNLGSDGTATTVVVLEACFGASADGAYALRDVADFALAAPAELPSPGLPWPETADAVIAASSDGAGAGLSDALRAVTGDRWSQSWSMLWIEPGRLDAVATALEQFCSETERYPEQTANSILRLRASAPAGLRQREMTGLARLARVIGGQQPGTELSERAETLALAAENAVIQCVRLGPAAQDEWGETPGITVYLPGPFSGRSAGRNTWSALARRTGYDRFIEFYVQHCGRLVPGLGPTA